MSAAGRMILQSILSGFQQPTAQLGETNAAAGAAGASAGLSSQETQNARIAQVHDQQVADQVKFMKDSQALFDKSKNKQGFVDPNVYNQAKQAATQFNIDGDSFDNAFKQGGYVDPTKEINYNTAQGLQSQKQYGDIRRSVQNLLTQYQNVPSDQKGVFGKANVPNLTFVDGITKKPMEYLQFLQHGPKNYLSQAAPDALSYEGQRSALIANLRGLASEQSGQGVRTTQQLLNNLEQTLPSTTVSDTVNNNRIKSLDSGIKASFNVPVGLDPQYLKNASTGSNPYKIIQIH